MIGGVTVTNCLVDVEERSPEYLTEDLPEELPATLDDEILKPKERRTCARNEALSTEEARD